MMKLIGVLLILLHYSDSQSLTANNHALIFDPETLTVAVNHNVTTIIQLVSEYEGKVRVDFVYGEDRLPTTDYITPLQSIEFAPHKTRVQVVLQITGLRPGHLIVGCNTSDIVDQHLIENDFLRVNIARSRSLDRVISVVGWIYFLAWSFSFYPQIFLNFHRKSVVGLNFDFVALNLVGFFCYSVYNIAMYSWRTVQNDYHKTNPHGVIPVLLNDLIFGLHGFIATFLIIIQCLLFERGNQRVSYKTGIILFLVTLFLSITTLVTSVGRMDLLLLIYFYSYVKLIISVIKYLPQMWMNYQRKSTEGWAIGNIFLDFLGGALSLIQMFLLASNYDDWKSIFGSISKFGLAIVSMGFDLIFILQHYKFYRNEPRSSNREYRILDDQDDETTVQS